MDVSQLQILVGDYEILVNELTNELRSVKTELEELKVKVPSILSENQRLIEELKECVSWKKSKDSQIDKNLRSQIDLVLSEKEQVTQLWREAIKSVEKLEKELDVYKSGSVEYVTKQEHLRIKNSQEDTINRLKHEIKILENESESKRFEVQNLLKSSVNSSEAVKKSESKVGNLQDSVEDLKKKCKEKEGLLKKVMDQNKEFREKVIEAIEVVQAALNEKDASLLREGKIREDMNKMNQEFDGILKEMQEKCNIDVSRVREEAECKYKDYMNRLKNVEEELKEKLMKIEKLEAKNIILQNEIDKFSAGGIVTEDSKVSKLLILEKNLESTFQKLLVSEKQNIQLKSELESVKNDLEQMVGYYERVLKTKDLEKLSLQNINNQQQSVNKENELKMKNLTNEFEIKKNQWEISEKDYEKFIENQNKLIASIKVEKNEVVEDFKEHAKELNNEIDIKDEINRKILVETKEIIEKLENLSKNLKTESRRLKKENKILKEELEVCKIKLQQYKEILNMLAVDVNKINVLYSSGNQENLPNILS